MFRSDSSHVINVQIVHLIEKKCWTFFFALEIFRRLKGLYKRTHATEDNLFLPNLFFSTPSEYDSKPDCVSMIF